jgi:hypothetical protein
VPHELGCDTCPPCHVIYQVDLWLAPLRCLPTFGALMTFDSEPLSPWDLRSDFPFLLGLRVADSILQTRWRWAATFILGRRFVRTYFRGWASIWESTWPLARIPNTNNSRKNNFQKNLVYEVFKPFGSRKPHILQRFTIYTLKIQPHNYFWWLVILLLDLIVAQIYCWWPNLTSLKKSDYSVCNFGTSGYDSFRAKSSKELNLKI